MWTTAPSLPNMPQSFMGFNRGGTLIMRRKGQQACRQWDCLQGRCPCR